jgi:uncharacterized protein YecE (DUF72 family)
MKKLPSNLHVGTSSWSSTDWYEVFYPTDLKPAEFITHYAQHFNTVEIDSTWHHMPSTFVVDGWRKKTPDGFVFSAKVPQTVTHKKYLEDCQEEMTRFLKTMERLGEKLGPLVFQFPYFAKGKDEHEYKTGEDFLRRLREFLPTLPKDFRYTVEVRNSNWLTDDLLSLLTEHNIALTLISFYTMPALDDLMKKMDVVTSDFTLIRFLGHHKQIDSLIAKMMEEGKKEKEWNELVIDRTREMERWVPAIQVLVKRKIQVYVYFNNHYAGYGIGSIRLFEEIWQKSEE